ncbi:MAG: hypothetical protein ACM359_07495 [Bacillota bacterium]
MEQFMLNQRWFGRRDSYRLPSEVISTRAYEVAPVPDDRTAKAFVCEHHYSATYPAARYRFGLYRGDALVGIAVFSHPCNDRVLTSVFPASPAESTELGRFVLLDSVPGNGETWFLGRCFELLKRVGIVGVVSYSDPEPRITTEGRVIFGGHVGTIYQAHNAAYLGRSTLRYLRLLPDGTVLSARAIQKVRGKEQGWRYAAERLVAFGAEEPGSNLREWLSVWIPRLTRLWKHPGNHKYAWGLDRTMRQSLPASLPYPKQTTPLSALGPALHGVAW